MALDPSTLVAGNVCGVLDNNETKHRVEVVKNNKRDKKLLVKLGNGKQIAVAYDRVRGLQGRKPKGEGEASAPATAPKAPAPKAAAALAPSKTPAANGNGKTDTYADVIERVKDLQARLADITNELYDAYELLEKFDGGTAPAPAAKGRGRGAPMDDAPNFD